MRVQAQSKHELDRKGSEQLVVGRPEKEKDVADHALLCPSKATSRCPGRAWTRHTRSAPDLPWHAPHASKEAYGWSAVAPPSPTQLLTSRVFATRVTTGYRSLHCMHDNKKIWCPPAHLSTSHHESAQVPRVGRQATTTQRCRRNNRRVLRIAG